MVAYLEYVSKSGRQGVEEHIEEHTLINGGVFNIRKIIPCSNIVDRCDVEYPRFPCWQACGYSYIEANGLVSCKNHEMIESILKK